MRTSSLTIFKYLNFEVSFKWFYLDDGNEEFSDMIFIMHI